MNINLTGDTISLALAGSRSILYRIRESRSDARQMKKNLEFVSREATAGSSLGRESEVKASQIRESRSDGRWMKNISNS